jgi:hypothetical protein
MPEPDKAAVAEILKPLMQLWASRDERKAARQAGRLRFWKDGMLKQLNEFAEGKATAETSKKLKAQLRNGDMEVTAAIDMMRKVRNRLGSSFVLGLDCMRNSTLRLVLSTSFHHYHWSACWRCIGLRKCACVHGRDRLMNILVK